MKFLESGEIRFCACGRSAQCPAFNDTLALSCKIIDLCLMGLGLGYNVVASHFGVSESAQKELVSGSGYELDVSTGYYLLSETAKGVLKGSKFVNPMVPACIFDCVQMTM